MSDFSSDDDNLRPAFPISKHYLPPTDAPPTSVEEYLSLIHHQSAALPKVIISRLKPISPPPSAAPLQSRFALPDTPAYLHPHPSWQARLVLSFKNLQHSLQIYSRKHHSENPGSVPQIPWKDVLFREPDQLPTLDVVLRLDHLRIVDALRTIDLEITMECPEKRGDKNQAHTLLGQFMRANCCVWLFALLSMLSLPLSNEPAAILRSLLRKAFMARLAYVREEGESENEHVNRLRTCERLAGVNVLITLLAKVFEQGDQT